MIKRTYENILINEIDNIDYIVVEIIDDEFIDDDGFDIENAVSTTTAMTFFPEVSTLQSHP